MIITCLITKKKFNLIKCLHNPRNASAELQSETFIVKITAGKHQLIPNNICELVSHDTVLISILINSL